MNRTGVILIAVAALAVVAAAAVYIVQSDNGGDRSGNGMYSVGEGMTVQVKYTSDLGENSMTYPEYVVTGYEDGKAIVENGVEGITYRIQDGGLVSLAFPLVDYMFGMTVVGTEDISTSVGDYACEVWTAEEGDGYCAVYVDVATGNVVRTVQNGTFGGVGFTEVRSLSLNDNPIEPFVMTDEMRIKSGLGVGDYITYAVEQTDDGVTETYDRTYRVTSVDGFSVGYDIESNGNTVSDRLDVRLFIDLFCPGEDRSMVISGPEAVSTPYGDAECAVWSDMTQEYGFRMWVSEENGLMYKFESNRPDGMSSVNILKDTSMV